jgi:hypothetical protein
VERIPVGFARQHAVLAFHADDADDESTDVAIGSMESWTDKSRGLLCGAGPRGGA